MQNCISGKYVGNHVAVTIRYTSFDGQWHKGQHYYSLTHTGVPNVDSHNIARIFLYSKAHSLNFSDLYVEIKYYVSPHKPPVVLSLLFIKNTRKTFYLTLDFVVS